MAKDEIPAIHPLALSRLESLALHFRNRRVLVTGGLGFIGSSVVHALAHLGGRVLNLDSRTYAANPENLKGVPPRLAETRHVDVANEAEVARAFQEHQPEYVFHLAAESHVDRSINDASAFIRTNIDGTRVLLDAARKAASPLTAFVVVSTDEVYGDIPMNAAPVDEGAPWRPSSPYSASKAGAELLALSYIRTHGLPVIITRGSNTYGPRQHPEKFIPRALASMKAKQPIPMYGDGLQRRDWLFVDDHARGILSAAASIRALTGPSQTPHDWGSVNLAFGRDIPNRELLERLTRAAAQDGWAAQDTLLRLITPVVDRPGHDRRYAIAAGRAAARLGWSPSVGLDDGLAWTVRWYNANPARLGQ